MSQEPATAQQGAPDRDLLDWLLVRMPPVASLIGAGLNRTRPGSSLRRRLINLLVQRGFAAMARSDIEVVLLLYEPEVELWMRSMARVGVRDSYRGHEGVRALYADLDDAFGDWRWTIRAVVDLGDRLAVQADFVGHGRSSGVETTLKNGGTAVRLSHQGRIVWQEWFVENDGWTKALEAAGLSE
jgi:ketosteroid isomerase-like protein